MSTTLSLYPYQSFGIDWLLSKRRAILADAPGAGKTAQLIHSIDTPAALIICPASIKYNWEHELLIWQSKLNPTVIDCNANSKFPLEGEAVISSYDLVENLIATVTTDYPITLIIDECHALCNRHTKRATLIRKLTTALHPDSRIYGASGTPFINHPEELWNLLFALNLESQTWALPCLMQYEFSLDKAPRSKWGKPTQSALSTINSIMLRRETETVLPHLPERRWRTIEINPHECINDYASLKVILDDASDRLEQYLALQPPDKPVDNLPPMPEVARARAMLAAAKLPFATQIVDELATQDQQVVVFSAHKTPIKALGMRPHWTHIEGAISPRERHRRTTDFQAGKYQGIALTIGAGKEGINLYAANQLLFIDLAWTPAANIQAEGRIYRNGQKNGCLFTTLVLDHPLDRRLAQILWRKEISFRATIRESKNTGVSAFTHAA